MLFRRLRMYRYWCVLLCVFILTGCLDGSNSGNIYTKSDPDNAFSVGADGCPIPQLNKATPTTTIRVLFLDATGGANTEAEVRQALTVAETTYRDSDVPLKLEFADFPTYSPSSASECDASSGTQAAFSKCLVQLFNEAKDVSSDTYQERNSNEADIIVLIKGIPKPTPGSSYTCGLAYNPYTYGQNPSEPTLKEQALTVVNLSSNCGGPDGGTLAHEIGHILGLTHGNPGDDPNRGFKSYSKGFAQQGVFGTTMVYGYLWDVKQKCELPIFSNPDMAGCDPMLGCGIQNQIDAVRSIKQTMGQVSQIFP